MIRESLVSEPLSTVDGDQLVDELTVRDVHFLRGGTLEPVATLSTTQLLAALASSAEARVRLAIIPLLVRHSEYAQAVSAALLTISLTAQITLKCYYTAACILQRKYAAELPMLLVSNTPLPDLFSAELGILSRGAPDQHLQQLGQRQALLTDFHLNWPGTYEHAMQTFLTILQHRKVWQL